MRKKITKLIIGLGILSLVLISVNIFVPNNQYRVIFCDVGQGDAILITAPNNIQVLIDGGPDQRILEKLGKYMPYNDRTIEAVMVTHPHADHLAGLLEVAKRYRIGQVIETDMPDNDQLVIAWEEILNQHSINVVRGQTGQSWSFDEYLSMTIIYASDQLADTVKDLNELSLVSLIDIKGRHFLMTGDMNLSMEESIMVGGQIPEVNVLKIAHHGSHFASGLEWLEKIKPNLAVISVGQPNRYGHPAPEVITRLMQQNILYWRTDHSGDIRMILKNEEWVTETDKNVIMQPKK
jgi:competence protein ComEC